MRQPQYIIYTWTREVAQGLAMYSALLEDPGLMPSTRVGQLTLHTYMKLPRDKFIKNNMEPF